ncbi:EamA family transporter [Sellimonas intestinalis]|uniref:EamA family transporter n=1 Tax=Sellimonas intestinalis TaxID=1653434 RepID=UPI0015EC3A70|nr:EamA family transporter [Sellimonas intestinalis]MBA2214482.1 EamA family transporter [Sellimonas intestinalis]
MIYLILAILCSAGVSIFMRASEKYCQGHYGILLMNYVVCVLAGLILTGRGLTQTDGKGMPVTIVFGVVTGLLYCGSFILLQWNVRKNGVILSSTFMKLGVIVPAVLAVIWFGERPGWNQGLGFILAITAILMIHLEKGKIRTEKAYTIGLLLLLLGGGLGDSMAKFYDVYGNPGLGSFFLMLSFLVSGIISGILVFRGREKITKYEVLFGVLIGIPNYFSARFLLWALADIPAVITYPTYSIAAMALIGAAGVLMFREKLTKRQWGAYLLVILAVGLLNM